MTTKSPTKQPLPNGYISKGGQEAYDVHDNYQATSTYLSPNPKAFHVRVHVNNDKFEPGKKMTVATNKIKTFENFLEECTEKIKPPFGAARRLYTARGRHRIQRLEELQEDSIYVITGNEPFKKYNYREIPEKTRPAHRKGHKKNDLEQTYTPVQHALEERLRKKSGRSYYLNEHRKGLRLRVHINGYNERPSCPVSIRYSDKDNFLKILQEIETTLNTQPIKKVYKVVNQGGYAENFNEVTDASELQHDDHLLVLPNNDHKLQVKFYALEGKNNFKVTTSPRAGQYYLYPSFPAEPPQYKHNKSLNKHKPLPSIGSSKQSDAMSPFSNPPGSTGGRKNNKPKAPKQIDYDKDEGGVYRAKKQNNARGAQQVNETRETHTEKPIDQMEAEIVEEEQIREGKEKTTPIPPGTELNKQPSREKKQNAENGSQTKQSGEVKKGGKPSNKDSNKVGVLPPIVDEGSREMEKKTVKDTNNIKKGHVKESVEKIEKNLQNTEELERGETPKELKTDDVVEELQNVATPTPSDLKANEMEANKPPLSTTPPEGKVSRASGPDKERVNEEAAAAKIQAGARGYKARKEYKAKKEAMTQQHEAEMRHEAEERQREEEERRREAEALKQNAAQNQKKAMDEDMAASKIQAGFKGYKQRKEYNLKKQQGQK